MIIFDTETTGLLKQEILDLDKQPKIIEFAAIKLDDSTLEEKERIEFLINTNQEIPQIITKITGLRTDDFKDAFSFEHHFQKLAEFFIGEKYLIAHNLAFDVGMLRVDLERIGKLTNFPFPPIQICTVQSTFQIKGYRLNLTNLYQHLFNDTFPEAHRAMRDVEALTKCVKNLINNQIIKL
jgi:DNA polymerase III epsilon subunit-like protein